MAKELRSNRETEPITPLIQLFTLVYKLGSTFCVRLTSLFSQFPTCFEPLQVKSFGPVPVIAIELSFGSSSTLPNILLLLATFQQVELDG